MTPTNTPAPASEAADVEPVAWLRQWNFRGATCPADFTDDAQLAELWRGHPQTDEVITLTPLAEAESTIRSLKERLAEAEKVLEPFANEADQWEGYDDGECLVEGWENGPSSSITVGDLRHARAFLTKHKEGQP